MENKKKLKESDSSLFNAIMSFYIHQDQLIYQRVPFLIVLQGGILTAFMSLKNSIWAAFVLFLGALITIIIFFIMKRDEQLRDINEKILEKLGEDLVRNSIGSKYGKVVVNCKPKWPAPLRVRYIVIFIIFLFISIDLTLGIILLKGIKPY